MNGVRGSNQSKLKSWANQLQVNSNNQTARSFVHLLEHGSGSTVIRQVEGLSLQEEDEEEEKGEEKDEEEGEEEGRTETS